MYFPMMRAKQNELLALRECLDHRDGNWDFVPCIEPVRKNLRPLLKLLDTYNAHGAPYIVIINPSVGELANSDTSLTAELTDRVATSNSLASVGILVSARSSARSVQALASSIGDIPLSLFHVSQPPDVAVGDLSPDSHDIRYHLFADWSTSHEYRSDTSVMGQRVLVQDNFRQMRNADYPHDEFFSDLHRRLDTMGFDGFGDYQIVGRDYRESGGPAHAVTIHLTYQDGGGDIRVRHFVSDRTQGAHDTAGKYLEALNKLIAFVDEHPEWERWSPALTEFRELHRRMHFPNLGPVKKLSMKHHLDLMTTQIRHGN